MTERFNENSDHQEITNVPAKLDNLQILVTEDDINGTDILAMSDFLDGYIEEMTKSLRENVSDTETVDVPVSDFVIVGGVVHQAKAVTHGMVQYIPDFEHLPTEIKEKFRKGIYKIGESRQVDGNVRAVLVDQEGVRVKDITLKEVHPDTGIIEMSRSIANQIQMKQISSKLDIIEAMQSYQIARDRDRDIFSPFLDARALIVRAQKEDESEEERKKYLKQAEEKLLSALNSLYLDINTSGKTLIKHTRRKIFQNGNVINECIEFISSDLQVLAKMTGLRVRVLSCLGDRKSIEIEVDRYKNQMKWFFTSPLIECGCTMAELIHQHYPYTSENMDCWYKLSEDMKKPLEELEMNGMDHIYLVSVEDVEDGTE